MPDQPTHDQPQDPNAGEPTPEENAGWFDPSQEPGDALDDTGGWTTPDNTSNDASWHTPDDDGPAPASSPSEQQGAIPGAWHIPSASSDDEAAPLESASEQVVEGGWRIPEAVSGEDLLAGVDATIYPQPEPAPQDEATGLTPAIEDEDADEAEDEDFSGPVVGTEEERLLYENQDPATIAAMMAAQYDEDADDNLLLDDSDTVFDENAVDLSDPAAIAAAHVRALTGDAEDDDPDAGILLADEPTPSPEATSPLAGLIAQFDTVEERVGELRQDYHNGLMTRDELQGELRKLMILDEQGYWWMVGMESDIWYRYENGDWVQAERPRLATESDQGLGTDAMLASEAARYDTYTEYQDELDLDGQLNDEDLPILEQRVPRIDPEATLVGASAVEFDRLSEAEATMPGQAYQADLTQPGYAVARDADYQQPDYERAFDANQSDMYRQAQARQAQQTRSWATRAAIAIVSGSLILLLVAIVGMILFYMSKVGQYDERIEALAAIAGQFETTRIYDQSGNLLSQINDPTGGTRISVPLEEMSPYLIHATISTENERFYQDPGWDAIAVVRAVIQNVQEGAVVSGFSSITQQLARALVLDADRRAEITISRKIDEVIIAAEIGRRYSKNEILELYLNEIYYGNLAYGAEAAAQTYFGISARDLNLPQAALLVGLVGSPATYDPVANREAAFDRMDAVINFMLTQGCIQFQHEPYLTEGPFCITDQDVRNAVVEKAEVEAREYNIPSNTIRYPHFVNYVAQQLEENYGLADIYRAGFNVYTTLNPDLQDMTQSVVAEEVARLQAQGIGGNNASVVVMNPGDGAILAMVGSVDYGNEDIDGQVNVALSPQQPGSSIKPLVYLAAFQGNPSGQYWYPGTVVWDTPTCWGTYCPTNYDGAYHGPQSVRSALANSYNIPAVKAMDFVTPDRFAQVAQSVGLTFPGSTPQQAGLTGALGGFDVRLYDMVAAFGVLANNGSRVAPYTITRITDNDGNEIPIPTRPEPQQVVQPEHAYMITHILADNQARTPAFGANSVLNIPGYTVAVKTGTTNDNRDNWTIGYTPNVVVGVWHGNTDNSPMRGTSGLTGAGPIWNRVMTTALQSLPTSQFNQPGSVTVGEICADSGTAPSQACLNRRQELYAVAQPPAGPEQDIYERVQVSTLYNLRANEFCPNFVAEQLFLNISDPTAFEWINNTAAGQQWATQRSIPLPARPVPTEACNPNIQQPILAIDSPTANSEVSGIVEITGRVLVYNFRAYQLEYGIGNQPQNFTIVDGPYNVQHSTTEFLGRWDVTQLPNGPYTLRLSALTNDGGYATLDQVVIVNNIAATETPTVTPTVSIVTQTPTPIIATTIAPVITATPSWTPPVVITATPIVVTTVAPVITATPGEPPAQTALPTRDPNLDIPLSYGAVANNFINSSQVAVFYRFDGQAGDQVQITMEATAGELDTLLYLWDSSENMLAENDDAAGTDSEIIFTLPATGTYIIVATRFDVTAGFTEGEFQLTLQKTN